jgi:formate--tetrahydrofolate ligase
VFAKEVGVTGAMMAVLKEAILPNLVQSQEGVPAFVHGGPFANIAHGCNSVLATRMALAFGDWAITEAGFAFDLGAEKFLNIKAQAAGLNPAAIVIVATVRALKMHGGISLSALAEENTHAVSKGLENLEAHIDAARFFQKPIVVAVNRRHEDTKEELHTITDFCARLDIPCSIVDAYARGGDGAKDLAEKVKNAAHKVDGQTLPRLYSSEMTIQEKIEAISTRIYGASKVLLSPEAESKIKRAAKDGFSRLPICMAKTQNSLSDDPKRLGRPKDFAITVRDIEVASGAGFIVALAGDIMRMPGLPETPAAEKIDVDDQGNILNLT